MQIYKLFSPAHIYIYYIYIYVSWEKEHKHLTKTLFDSTGSRKDAAVIGFKRYVESLSLTVQIICLPKAFRLSPSSEVFYFKK